MWERNKRKQACSIISTAARSTNECSSCYKNEVNSPRFCLATHDVIPPRLGIKLISLARAHNRTHLIPPVRQHPKRTLDPLNFRRRTVPAAKFIEMSPSVPALVVTTSLRPHAGSALLPHFRSDGNGAMRFRHGGKVATVITEPLCPLVPSLCRSFAPFLCSIPLRSFTVNARKKTPARILLLFGKMRGVLQIIVWKFHRQGNEWEAETCSR